MNTSGVQRIDHAAHLFQRLWGAAIAAVLDAVVQIDDTLELITLRNLMGRNPSQKGTRVLGGFLDEAPLCQLVQQPLK